MFYQKFWTGVWDLGSGGIWIEEGLQMDFLWQQVTSWGRSRR